MVKHLYANFLNDVDAYRRSEAHWSELCDEIVSEFGNAHDWTTASRDQFREGNPMLDLMSLSTRKGIRIVQDEVHSDELDMGAWTDTRESHSGDGDTWDELVIYCALSEESVELARQLLVEWVQYEGPHKEFKPTIDRILKR